MKIKLFSCLFFSAQYLWLMAGSGNVYLADTAKLFYARNNEIYSPDGKQLLYFQKGNIFFNDNTDDKQNIFLMASSFNIESNNLESIYEKDNRAPAYTFSRNRFYTGRTESDDLREKSELIHVEKIKKWLSFYSSYNDSLLAYFNADSLPSSLAIVVAYTLIKKYELENKSAGQPKELPFKEATYVSLKPVWGNTTANEWMWDGKILRPRWNVDSRLAWEFDGKIIKPQYGNNIYLQYEWDGENFKPVWRNNRAEEWTWDGRLIKPVYDTDWAKQYIIENGIVKPWSNVHPEKEWRTDGEIPIPVIILVISGIAQPF